PLGWRGSTDVVVSRVSNPIAVYPDGSPAGDFGAYVLFTKDQTGTGAAFGQRFDDVSFLSPVSENGIYTASMFVLPSRSQRMGMFTVWLDSSANYMEASYDESVVIEGGEVTRLSAEVKAPTGAAYAAVMVRAEPGNGFSPW